jgi:hypothetical protein
MQAETTMTSDAQILARPAATGDGPDPRRWLTLVILLLAAFMNLLDSTDKAVTCYDGSRRR